MYKHTITTPISYTYGLAGGGGGTGLRDYYKLGTNEVKYPRSADNTDFWRKRDFVLKRP